MACTLYSQTIGQSGEFSCPYDVVVNNNSHLLVANLYMVANCVSVCLLLMVPNNSINRIGMAVVIVKMLYHKTLV